MKVDYEYGSMLIVFKLKKADHIKTSIRLVLLITIVSIVMSRRKLLSL